MTIDDCPVCASSTCAGCDAVYTGYKEQKRRRSAPYYRRCPDCGAYLDPGEQCDCQCVTLTAK